MGLHRTVLTLSLGALAGFALALSSGVLAERGRSLAGLPAEDTRLLAEVLERIKGEYVEPVDDHQLMSHAIRGMVSGLDPHSAFMDRSEFEDLRVATEGHYSGIGIEVTLEQGTIIVVSPLEGSPAERAGVQPGDVIMAIDGREVGRTRIGQSIARMRGPPGTVVRLTLERDGEDEPLELSLERAIVSVRSVRHAWLAPGYGYLRISQFNERTGDDVELALHELRRAGGRALQGLVLDLRNNPGGVLEAAVQVSDAFLEKGVIVSAEGRTDEARFKLRATAGDLAGGAPMVVLVNGGSASAAEIVAGALRDHRRATLMGRTTFGKGSVQTVLALEDGQAIKLTTSRYMTPSGARIQGQGIAPDIELPRRAAGPPAPDAAEADPEVRAALDWLQGARPRTGIAADGATAAVH